MAEMHMRFNFEGQWHQRRDSNMEFNKGSFLLEMQLDPTDVENNVLVFPYDKASKYFPSVPNRSSERNVEFSDHLKNWWNMKLSYSHIDREFALTDNWIDFLDHHRLDCKDVIYFSIPSRRLHDHHYLIEYVRRAEIEGNVPEATATYEFPICEAETMDLRQGEGNCFLFKLPLTNNDITSGKLVIPTKEVKDHFPGTEIPPEIENLGNLWFVDERNKRWQMKLMFDYQADAYLVTDESMKFVKEHGLKAMDAIELYKSVGSLDARHFLIDHVKSNTARGEI